MKILPIVRIMPKIKFNAYASNPIDPSTILLHSIEFELVQLGPEDQRYFYICKSCNKSNISSFLGNEIPQETIDEMKLHIALHHSQQE